MNMTQDINIRKLTCLDSYTEKVNQDNQNSVNGNICRSVKRDFDDYNKILTVRLAQLPKIIT